jgi:hypothetical protein
MMVVQWDGENRRHLLLENGWRNISLEEVEEVLSRPLEQRCLRGGRRMYRGRTNAGRRLTVVVDVLSPQVVRPRTAWETQK